MTSSTWCSQLHQAEGPGAHGALAQVPGRLHRHRREGRVGHAGREVGVGVLQGHLEGVVAHRPQAGKGVRGALPHLAVALDDGEMVGGRARRERVGHPVPGVDEVGGRALPAVVELHPRLEGEGPHGGVGAGRPGIGHGRDHLHALRVVAGQAVVDLPGHLELHGTLQPGRVEGGGLHQEGLEGAAVGQFRGDVLPAAGREQREQREYQGQRGARRRHLLLTQGRLPSHDRMPIRGRQDYIRFAPVRASRRARPVPAWGRARLPVIMDA